MKIRPPRVSIATLIVVMALLAADCALLRSPFGGNDAAMLRLCILPMANVLAFCVYLALARTRRGEKASFLIGYVVAGCAASVVYLIGCDTYPFWLSMRLAPIYFPVNDICMNNLPYETMNSLDPTFTVTHKIATAVSLSAVSLVLTALFSIIALAGGFVVHRLKGAAQPRFDVPFPRQSSPLRSR
jgi:hypothetical protein